MNRRIDVCPVPAKIDSMISRYWTNPATVRRRALEVQEDIKIKLVGETEDLDYKTALANRKEEQSISGPALRLLSEKVEIKDYEREEH